MRLTTPAGRVAAPLCLCLAGLAWAVVDIGLWFARYRAEKEAPR